MSTSFPIQHLGANIEIYSAPPLRGLIQHAVFDFDGTLSLIRAGWQKIMLSLCVEALERTPTAEDRATLADTCRDFILQLTGRQTIYQMTRLAEEVRKHGGTPRDPNSRVSPQKRRKLRPFSLTKTHLLSRNSKTMKCHPTYLVFS